MLSLDNLKYALEENSLYILQKILIPSIVWRVGKPNGKIRKAGIINLIKLIDLDLLSGEKIFSCLKELIPPIKTCLSDDWAPDLRYATCICAEKLLY